MTSQSIKLILVLRHFCLNVSNYTELVAISCEMIHITSVNFSRKSKKKRRKEKREGRPENKSHEEPYFSKGEKNTSETYVYLYNFN